MSSAYQSNLLKSFHKFLHKSWSDSGPIKNDYLVISAVILKNTTTASTPLFFAKPTVSSILDTKVCVHVQVKVKVILGKTTIYIEWFNERKVSPTTMDASLCTCGESSGQNLHRAERLGAHQDQARAPFVHQSEITFFLIPIVIVLNHL